MNSALHLIVPFAAVDDHACRQSWPALQLPNLAQLLQRLPAPVVDSGSAQDFSSPPERALAQAIRLPGSDGFYAWAAWQQQDFSDTALATITPCHWQLRRETVVLLNPLLLQLDDAASRALLEAVQPLFADAGLQLHYASPLCWLARGDMLRHLRCISIDQALGTDVRYWLNQEDAAPAALRRLQADVQMLLHSHPLNTSRREQMLPPVNAFWVSGAGALQHPPAPRESAIVADELRTAPLRGDWSAWQQAWQAVDASHCARLLQHILQGRPATLSLCGERTALCWSIQSAHGLLARLKQRLRKPPRLVDVFEQIAA